MVNVAHQRRLRAAKPSEVRVTIDVLSLGNRRADDRWNRVAVGDMLERLTWSLPRKEGIVGWEGAYAHPEHERLTYGEADRIVNRFANALLARGLRPKDRVLLACENSVEAYLVKLAVAKAGLVAAPVNPSLAPDVAQHLIRLTEPAFAVVDADCWTRLAPAFASASLAPGVTITIGGDAAPGSASFADFVRGAPDAEPDVVIHGDDICEILFTSGTTALPKGAMLSHVNAYMAAYGYALTLTRGARIESDLRLCSFLPLIYHIGGQIFSLPVLLSGGTLVIGRRTSPERVAAAVDREKITALWAGSPTMVHALADLLVREPGRYDVRSLRLLLYGWASITPSALATLKRFAGDELVAAEIFGQTEAIACHRFWPDQWRDTFERLCPESNYVGIPSPLLASYVRGDDGRSLEGRPGVVGEAVYRSPTVMGGYYRDEPATRAAFEGGWFHSGDVCAYDAEGLRVMVDRAKDIVKTGGENVSSLRVEAVLAQHPAVARVAVVGLPHERWGEAVTAVVIRRDGHEEVGEEALIAHCRETLAAFERPKRVVFVDAFPETVGGKVLKYVLRAELGDPRAARARRPIR
jgi:acyl-CoA synthetase (AMP-forming)/AMP-acid ligase II